jgi:PST family polysaccharide transporter
MKSIYSFGIWNFIRVQFFFINQYITQVVVGKVFGPAALGFFEKAYQLASTPRESIATQINSVMFSSFSRIQHDSNKVKEWLIKILIMESIILLPMMLGIIGVSDHFIIVLLGEKWAPSIIPLQILSLGLICQIFNGLIASLNVGIGRYKKQTLLEFPATIIFIVLCFFLKKWGINGISTAYSISMLILAIFTFSLSKKALSLPGAELLTKVSPYLFINTLMFILVRVLASTLLAQHTISNLVTLITIAILFYVILTVGYNKLKGKGWMYPLR